MRSPAHLITLKHRFSNQNFYTDDQHVYYFRGKVDDADPGTFEAIGNYFSKDDQHAYFCSKKCHIIDGTDTKTFHAVPIESNWANDRVYGRDKNRVFFCAELEEQNPCVALPDSEPNSFEYIGKYFSRDMSNVFFREKVVKGADAATFEIFQADDQKGLYRARDKNRMYNIRRVGAPNFYEFNIESDDKG